MAKLTGRQISTLARDLVIGTPGGLRYGQLLDRIRAQHPETPSNTINGNIWNLQQQFPHEITKPSRGLFVAIGAPEPAAKPQTQERLPREQEFYSSFADWLKGELGEATEAVEVGGAVFGRKWATPDVIGVYKPSAGDLVKFAPEIVSAEIKVSPDESVVAFGQAAAYRLFSTKVYVVLPRSVPQEDQDRMEALCLLFGAGLVLFTTDPKAPAYEIRARAQRFSPDMFYVNLLAEKLKAANRAVFEKLFS